MKLDTGVYSRKEDKTQKDTRKFLPEGITIKQFEKPEYKKTFHEVRKSTNRN